MKTPKQVRKWLKKQLWYRSYKYNLENDHHRPDDLKAEDFLSGHQGVSTIRYAFDWDDTQEGYHFWNMADNYFYKWYNRHFYRKMKRKFIDKVMEK